jgi:tRNA (guanine37-N1)-methyltransferase
MKIDIITLFQNMFDGPFAESIVHRAQEKGLVEIKIHNLRNWAVDERGTVDDRPFGGGPGMVLKPEPIFSAVEEIVGTRQQALGNSQKKEIKASAYSLVPSASVILLTPQGQPFNQQTARRLSKFENLILICGHYEGVDERVREHLTDEEISIGDYVLTGGELPAMVLTDAVVRLIPGVLEKEEATKSESFSALTRPGLASARPGLANLEFPQYTRPENFRGFKVPKVLLSGNHQEIEKWRKEQSEKRTKERRPDLVNT